MRRRTVRENWLAHVLFARELSDPCRRLLLCLALAEDSRGAWMNEAGRVRPVKHSVIAEALGIADKTVANRILEATTKGLLAKDPTSGNRGRASAYQATLPRTEPIKHEGPVSLRGLIASTVKVPVFGEPFSPGSREPFQRADGRKVPVFGEAQRARVTDVPLVALVPGNYQGGPVAWDREQSA